MNTVARNDAILRKLETKRLLTKSGSAWLKLSLDPFHDTPVTDCWGMPDRVPSASVVRLVKKSVSITRPIGFGGAQWSFQIIQWPFLNPVLFTERNSRRNNIIDGAFVASATHGGIEVMCLDTGSPAGVNRFNMNIDPQYRISLGNYSKGLSRVIGLGYELSDDTAELYKQGHSYHMRQANYSMQPSVWQTAASGGTSNTTWASMTPVRPIIPYPDEAMLLPDTVDWPAKEGCYCVASMNDGNLPRYVGYTQPIILTNLTPASTDEAETDIGNPHTALVYTPETSAIGLTNPINNGQYGPAIKVENLNQNSSMFTGLNPLGSYTLTVHFIVESFPSIAEPDVLVLARPSAKYDPIALEMYVHAVRKLPVAVRIGDNPDGEWWADVIRAATGALVPAAALFGFPEAMPFIAGGGKLLENAVRPSPQEVAQKKKVAAARLQSQASRVENRRGASNARGRKKK